MNINELDGVMFTKMVSGGTVNLQANRSVVNDLNVFPIPDGDTGDNMYLTMQAGVSAVSDEPSIEKASAKIAHGMLLGARGNSGVILSRVFSGMASGFVGVEKATVYDFARALRAGVAEAYHAVAVPVEGTILTVYKDAVDYATERIRDDSNLVTFFGDFTEEVNRSLERTPDLLAVLKEAGVVDSGGAGLVYIAEGMQTVLSGGEVTANEQSAVAQAPVDVSAFTEDSTLQFGYCTEFLLRLQRAKVDLSTFDVGALIEKIRAMGESVVAFADGSVVKVHIHTMHPGEVLNFCQQYGEFLTLKIENMMLQHSEAKIENRFPGVRTPHKAYGIVAVASGAGLRETFLSLGADFVVDGGQCMNPAAEDFIRAFEKIDADTILVFPNNGNVVLAASQAAGLYEKAKIAVVPTKTVGEGYAALSMLDTSSGDTDAIVGELTEIARSVVTGMVSRSVRDTVRGEISVHSGDYIGFVHDEILVDAENKVDAAFSLAKALHMGDYDVALILVGADASPEEAKTLSAKLSAEFSRTEVITVDGGQPVYDFMIILE